MNAARGNARIQHNLQLLCHDARFEGCLLAPSQGSQAQIRETQPLREFCSSCA
jgi:hypothetical protein